jgi:hypothetical protein
MRVMQRGQWLSFDFLEGAKLAKLSEVFDLGMWVLDIDDTKLDVDVNDVNK